MTQRRGIDLSEQPFEGPRPTVPRHDMRSRGSADRGRAPRSPRSEEHTSELQSLMRISYAVLCLKKKKTTRKSNSKQTLIPDTEPKKKRTYKSIKHNY